VCQETNSGTAKPHQGPKDGCQLFIRFLKCDIFHQQVINKADLKNGHNWFPFKTICLSFFHIQSHSYKIIF